MQAATGHIILVQEDRFLLEHDDGHKQLFVLSHSAPFDPEDLRSFARSGRRVTVRYEVPGTLIAGAAIQIRPADGA